MLAGSFRLRKPADFNRVYRQGNYNSSKNLYARIRKTKLPVSRVAVVVSKKISKRAVVRNRARRRISEILRLQWAKINPGFDIIIVVKTDLSALDHKTLEDEIISLLSRAKLFQR